MMPDSIDLSKIGSDEVIRRLPPVSVYLIAGPTGSGKTIFAQRLAASVGAMMLSLDNYFWDEAQVEIVRDEIYGEARQWDDPASSDLNLLTLNIQQLVNDGYALIPQFDFFQNIRIGYAPMQKKEETQSIVVEGLHSIRCKGPLADLGISSLSLFIDADVQVRAERVRIRDLRDRGRPEELFQKRFHFIRLAEEKWILEQRHQADVLIDTGNGFAD
jgi:uridine kinase